LVAREHPSRTTVGYPAPTALKHERDAGAVRWRATQLRRGTRVCSVS